MVTSSGVGHGRARYYYDWPLDERSGSCTEISLREEVSEDDEQGYGILTAAFALEPPPLNSLEYSSILDILHGQVLRGH